jgi:hypothetical protein
VALRAALALEFSYRVTAAYRLYVALILLLDVKKLMSHPNATLAGVSSRRDLYLSQRCKRHE